MIRKRPRDWFKILRHLVRAGVSYAEVARHCNRNATTVQGWAEHSEPKESDARVVLALYRLHCPDEYQKEQDEIEREIRIALIAQGRAG